MHRLVGTILSAAVLASTAMPAPSFAQAPRPGVKGYEVEWVYRVRYGHIDEWWDIFRKYQVALLDREKVLGYVVDYRIYHPQLHTDENARWDYRVEIVYRDFEGSSHEDELTEQMFPDKAALTTQSSGAKPISVEKVWLSPPLRTRIFRA